MLWTQDSKTRRINSCSSILTTYIPPWNIRPWSLALKMPINRQKGAWWISGRWSKFGGETDFVRDHRYIICMLFCPTSNKDLSVLDLMPPGRSITRVEIEITGSRVGTEEKSLPWYEKTCYEHSVYNCSTGI